MPFSFASGSFAFVVSWSLLACGAGSADSTPPASAPSPNEPPPPAAAAADSVPAALLRAHNAVRAEVGTKPLSWSEPAARSAKQYVERCQWGHSSSTYGENLFAASAGGSPDEVVTSWADEKKFYDPKTGACTGGECGHYSQVVWSSTTEVGCAKATCATGSPFGSGSWVYWVCQYSPAGNYTNQRAY